MEVWNLLAGTELLAGMSYQLADNDLGEEGGGVQHNQI